MIILGVALTVVAVLVVGLVVARRVDGDTTNFLVAGRALPLPLAAAGLMGQAVDSNATLGNTDLTASFGFWAGASLPLGLALCLLLTGIFFAPRMNRMRLYTLGDFYRRRYGRLVEVLSSVLMVVSFGILLAGNLVAGGLILDRFLGTGYALGVVLLVAVILTYTVAGGMISDAYTAALQMIITLVAVVALFLWVATTYGISIPEGMGPFDLGQLTDPAQGAPINWGTLFALALGDIVALDFMQRIFSAGSPSIARRACFVGAAGTAFVGVLYALIALSAGTAVDPADGPVLFTIITDAAPIGLAILVLSGIIAASCSTANGAVLGTASVITRNIVGQRRLGTGHGHTDTQLRLVRLFMLPVVGIGILLAIQVPQTGILLTLAFDVMGACLLVPFALGVYWARSTPAAALAAILTGAVVRLTTFVLTPTIYGAPNDLLYVPNSFVTAGFDGYPVFLATGASLVVFVVTALLTTPRPELHDVEGIGAREEIDLRVPAARQAEGVPAGQA
ncbi:sodium:solute symporter family protein [Aquipuribacter nitratireducens]|uniref:Sodium:solute symporter family protein n=1 Tax=Aquipuribacter nitratireducens TaxID=650104 RepID=A0ABW0GHA2_9MICO